MLYEELGIDSLEALREAAEQQRLRDAQGLRAQGGGEHPRRAGGRRPAARRASASCSTARWRSAEPIVEALREHPAAERVELAGSARRMADSVKDLDIIATAARPAARWPRRWRELESVEALASTGEAGARASPRTRDEGRPADRRARAVRQPAPALHRLQAAQHGAARGGGAPRAARLRVRRPRRRDRRDAPLRDRGGGLRAARAGRTSSPSCARTAASSRRRPTGAAPRPGRLDDLRGDLHCHTVASDGRNTIEEMALAARERGYEYLAITDHSATHGFGNDVSPDALERQIERVREVNARVDGHRAAGRQRGQHPARRLARLRRRAARPARLGDRARCTPPSGMDEQEMTDRIVAAIEHPLVDAIGHLTGRKIERRAPYAVDVERGHRGRGAHRDDAGDQRQPQPPRPQRRPRARRRRGRRADPHRLRRPRRRRRSACARYGIATARRAWLTRRDVANTRSWPEFAAAAQARAESLEAGVGADGGRLRGVLRRAGGGRTGARRRVALRVVAQGDGHRVLGDVGELEWMGWCPSSRGSRPRRRRLAA